MSKQSLTYESDLSVPNIFIFNTQLLNSFLQQILCLLLFLVSYFYECVQYNSLLQVNFLKLPLPLTFKSPVQEMGKNKSELLVLYLSFFFFLKKRHTTGNSDGLFFLPSLLGNPRLQCESLSLKEPEIALSCVSLSQHPKRNQPAQYLFIFTKKVIKNYLQKVVFHKQ